MFFSESSVKIDIVSCHCKCGLFSQVQERFMLHCSDEEAVHFMQNLIEVSVTSMMPALVEQLHKVAQVFRKVYF